MVKYLITLFLIFFSLSSRSDSGLKCSKNGTQVLYVNGVNVNKSGNAISTIKIDDIIKKLPKDKSIDLEDYQVLGVWNASRGLFQDADELQAMLAANHSGQKRLDFWKKFAEKKLEDRLRKGVKSYDSTEEMDDDITVQKIENVLKIATDKTKVKFSVDGKAIEQLSYKEEDYRKDFKIFDREMFNIIANATSDVAVVQQLVNTIKEKYNNGENKLLIISHSQGNEVAYSAIKQIRNDQDSFLKTYDDLVKFDSLVGYMQVAPPSPKRITDSGNYDPDNFERENYRKDHAQYIRHSKDGVIGLSSFFTGVEPLPANYVSGFDLKFDDLFFSNLPKFLDIFFSNVKNSSILTLNHGMDEIYLGEYKATRNSTGKLATLREHFEDNLREIASKLENNCIPMKIQVSTGGELVKDLQTSTSSNFAYNYNNYAFPGNEVSFYLSDEGSFGDKTVFKILQNGVYVESKTGSISLPYPDTFGASIVASNPKTGESKSFAVNVTVTKNKAPVLASGWVPACQSGYDENGGEILTGNLLFFSVDITNDTDSRLYITNTEGGGIGGVAITLLESSPGYYKYRFEFGNLENFTYIIKDDSGNALSITSPSNPCKSN